MSLTTLASEAAHTDADDNPDNASWSDLLQELTQLRAGAEQFAERAASSQLAPTYQDSARNLLHYLYVRRHDLRPLQARLANLGLSSLGRCESHVMHSLNALIRLLGQLCERSRQPAPPAMDLLAGTIALEQHTTDLLGPAPRDRHVRIMVTMPADAIQQPALITELLQNGMDCMRINCAHDDASIWQALIDLLRQAEEDTGKRCRVLMDLAGPKLRTGTMGPGPAVNKIRPLRDATGHVLEPALVWITNQRHPHPAPQPVQACIQVADNWLQKLRSGQTIRFRDTRAAKRILMVRQVLDGGCLAESTQTAYLANGLTLKCGKLTTPISGIPSRAAAIHLTRHDRLILTRAPAPGQDAIRAPDGTVLKPAQISCTLPQVFNDLVPGQTVWFDDGKLGGIIESVSAEQVCVRIQHVRQEGASLRGDKGINFPDTSLNLPALTAKDLNDLPFIVQHADMVALSFANSAADVLALQHAIRAQSDNPPGIVLKVETRRGLDNLPAMLFAAMRNERCGVMIARGDLAVECGFERLAEVQEELLWLCEAAHIPVIWATQVLESLAKTGLPSRAEITDAAMSDRAECVMLNKGAHILRAVQVLDDILRRMQQHQQKKSAQLRALHLASGYPPQ